VKKLVSDQKDDSSKKFMKILTDFKDLILPRTDIFDNLDQPFFEKLVNGAYIRVVSGPNQYRLVRIKSVVDDREAAPYNLVS
jgi:hypothetical protein